MTIPRNGTTKSITLSVKEVWARLRTSLEAPQTNNGIEKNMEIKVIGLTRLFIRMREGDSVPGHRCCHAQNCSKQQDYAPEGTNDYLLTSGKVLCSSSPPNQPWFAQRSHHDERDSNNRK